VFFLIEKVNNFDTFTIYLLKNNFKRHLMSEDCHDIENKYLVFEYIIFRQSLYCTKKLPRILFKWPYVFLL